MTVARRRVVLLAAALSVAVACGGSTPSAAVPDAAKPLPKLYPDELVPADLDLVVRVDLAEARATLGDRMPAVSGVAGGAVPLGLLAPSADAEDPVAVAVLRTASAVIVARRIRHLVEGDGVLVAEGAKLDPPAGFREAASPRPGARVYLRESDAPRSGVQAVVFLDDRAIALVSPVEVDAVLRILARGPDDARGRPAADGLVTADVRPGPLPAAYEKRYRNVAALIARVSRLKLKLAVEEASLGLDATLVSQDDDGADALARFFATVATNVPDSPLGRVLGSIQQNRVGPVVHLRLRAPLELVAQLLDRPAAPSSP
jgi:hypothetical protein